ncbi:MAG: antitoxin [Thermoproteota archaeon]|nr:MAG: antitoxin [Candidatus Korarchaeota archaeon]
MCHGKPTFKGTRVLVSDVIELLAAGLSPEEIIRDYYPSLNKEMIREALEWAAKIIRGEHYVKYTELPA